MHEESELQKDFSFLLQDAGKNWSLKLDRSTNCFPTAPPSVLFQIGFKIFFTKFYIDEILIKKKKNPHHLTNNDNVPPDRQLELAHASNLHASFLPKKKLACIYQN